MQRFYVSSKTQLFGQSQEDNNTLCSNSTIECKPEMQKELIALLSLTLFSSFLLGLNPFISLIGKEYQAHLAVSGLSEQNLSFLKICLRTTVLLRYPYLNTCNIDMPYKVTYYQLLKAPRKNTRNLKCQISPGA